MIYNIVYSFVDRADRKSRDLSVSEIPAAVAAIDRSGDFIGWHITRNGVRIEYTGQRDQT
jgi:hypothetical protein